MDEVNAQNTDHITKDNIDRDAGLDKMAKAESVTDDLDIDDVEKSKDYLLAVHAYDWTVRDVYGDDDHVAIHCWALNQQSEPHLLRFTDFPAFCHVELPMFVRNRAYQWRPAAITSFMNMLSQRLGNDAPIRYTFKQAKKTYYYRGNRTFPMLQLCFNNLRAMRHCSNLFENALKTDDWGFIKCNVWEDSISVVRKLLTVRDVRYSQWYRVLAHKVEPELRVSSLEHEYVAEWDSMNAIPLEECKNWSTQPGVLAFDIECYSNNHRAMPDKYNALHTAYMISCIYQRYRDPSSRRRYGIIIGDCNHIPDEKLRNCEIIRVQTEYEMVEAFADVVRTTDPEILTGYNILGFDYPYLDHRVKRWLKQWPSMGRIVGEPSVMTSKTWKSGAYGHQSINILQMEGRISIDLLPIVKRDYKLDKYDLNTVCKKFIGKTKHDVTAPEMFLIYEDMRNTLTALLPILLEAEENPALNQDSNYIRRRNDAEEAFQRAKDETTRVMEYCIQDSELVIDLMERMNIWVGLVEMSNIVGTTIVELFTRGQQVRCMSQLYDLAARMGFILDKRDTPGFKFAGGFVYEPIPGLYDNIVCLDFASLYPSIMMAYNICYTTLVPPELYDLVPDDECNIIEFDQDEVEGAEDEDEEEILEELNERKKKTKIVKKHYRFKFYKNQEGLLPRLVRQLVAERRAVQRQISPIKDELKAYEKTEDIFIALEGYLNGTIHIGDVKEAKQRVKDLSESKPPAPPEVITAAKRDLLVAQLFSLSYATEQLEEKLAAKPPTHHALIDLARMEVAIAELYASGNRDSLVEYTNRLRESSPGRLLAIESHKTLIVVLDKRQLALKVSANSFFGFLGVHTGGMMPLIEGAMSITAKGRELIGLVRTYIEERYGGIQIYGDTDSVMMLLPHVKDGKECNYWGLRLAQEISGIKPGEKDCDGVVWPDGRPGLFPSPLAMEFEKAMRLLCLKKKKYAALLIGKDGNFKTEDVTDKHGNVIGNRLMMLKKGIILARRDNCFTGDTLVTLSNGTSVPIKNLTGENAKVYGWNGSGIAPGKQSAFMAQGKKRCIKIKVIDGRTITCTPEHRLLVRNIDGQIVWKEAKTLNLVTDKLVCGLEAPEDIIQPGEENWNLQIGDENFHLSGSDRPRTLAFMRILGYVNSDGSLSVREDGRIDCTVPLGHIIDANALLDDIELISGLRPAITPRVTKFSTFYQIRIPKAISKYFTQILGQEIGRRSSSESSWPGFLLEQDCPKAVLREFCGGLFGGDGISPYLTKQSQKVNTHKLDQTIIMGLSTRCEHSNSLKLKMEMLCDILSRAGYPGCRLSDSVETYSVNKQSTDANDLRIMYRIVSSSSDKCAFLRAIGYRYCIHKQMRQTAAQTLWRFEETVRKDRMKTMAKGHQIKVTTGCSYRKALDDAKAETLTDASILYPASIQAIGPKMFLQFCRNGPCSDNTLRRFCVMPTTMGWLNDINALPWFDKDGYAVNRDRTDAPVLYLPLHSIIDAGDHDVYDISVDGLESFIANGVVVHNCKFLRDTYTRILDMIMSKGGLDDAISVLVDAVQNLLDGGVPHEDLIIIRELGSNYKSDSYFMKVFSDELKKAGKIVNPGDRLDFVIVEDPTATLLGHKMRLSEQYVERMDSPNPERIDYNYYIEKVLMNSINQLFEVGFKGEIAQLQHVSYRPSNRHKTIYLDRPVQIILKMRERGYDIREFDNAIRYNVAHLKGITPPVTNVEPQPAKTLTLNISTPQPQVSAVQPQIQTRTPSVVAPTTPTLIMPRTPSVVAPTTPTLIMPRMALKSPPVQPQLTLTLNVETQVGIPCVQTHPVTISPTLSHVQSRIPAVGITNMPIQPRVPAGAVTNMPIQPTVPAGGITGNISIQPKVPAVPVTSLIINR